ncbi:MAG: glycoside hydrolase family 5 protein, partial [Actinomycetota bacterium]|nr:glycoside hydrolase family 5 protein [Actinomycetota bacterium]
QITALAVQSVWQVASQAAMLAVAGQIGDIAIRSDVSENFILGALPPGTLANWKVLVVAAESELVARKDVASGYPGLDSGGLLKLTEFPAIPESQVTNLTADLAAKVVKAANGSDFPDPEAVKFNLSVQAFTAKAAATTNLALSGLAAVDTFTPSATGTNGGPDVILATGQTTPSQNGLWAVSAGAWSRPTRFPAGGFVDRSCEVTIGGGSTPGVVWVLPVTTRVTIDTTAQAWTLRPILASELPASVGTMSGLPSAAGQVPLSNGTGSNVATWGAAPGGNPLAQTAKQVAPLLASAARPIASETAFGARIADEIKGAVDWAAANGAQMYLGEVGWPNASTYSNLANVDDPNRWNRAMANAMKLAMAAGQWVTYWKASINEDYDVLGVYSPPHGAANAASLSVANEQAAVLEGLYVPTNGARVGIAYEDGVQGFPQSGVDGVTTSLASNVREDPAFSFGGYQPMSFTYSTGRTVNARYAKQYDYGDAASYAYLGSRPNLTMVRLAIRWERVQRTLGGALDTTELARIDQAITWAAANGLGVILDIHNSGGYFLDNGTQGVFRALGGANLTQANFVSLWTLLSAHYKTDARVIGYGLMNEPGVGGAIGWYTIAQAVVTALRAIPDTKLVLVSSVSGALGDFNPSLAVPVTDSASNMRFEGHYYPDFDIFANSFDTLETAAAAQGYVPGILTSGKGSAVQPATGSAAAADALSRVITSLGAVGILPPPTQAADNFNRADSAVNLSGGAYSPSYGGVGIQSNKAYPLPGSTIPRAIAITSLADAVVQADVTLSGVRALVGVTGRVTGTLTYL